jgi:hypothetical protein
MDHIYNGNQSEYESVSREDEQLKNGSLFQDFNSNYIFNARCLWCLTPLQQYFSYIVAVSFIDEGNRSKPPTCRTSLKHLIHNVVSSTPRYDRGSNSQL